MKEQNLFYQKHIYALRRVQRLPNGPGAGKYPYILFHNFPKLCLFPSSGTIMVLSLIGTFCEATRGMTFKQS